MQHRPETWEGWQVWDLATRMGGQLRAIPGCVIGLDMTAALAMARASGISAVAVVEFMPVIEVAMVRRMNERTADGD